MMRKIVIAILSFSLFGSSCLIGTGLGGSIPGGRIIDHEDATIDGITAARIADAKADLVVAYWHTSHGNQLLAGMAGMDHFYGDRGWYTLNGVGGLRLIEQGPDVGAFDSSSVANSAALFQEDVRDYLADHADTNVVMASWCGQVGYDSTSEADIDSYLARISELETEYPDVVFVYMTGHADGSGLTGNLHLRNQQIREYCEENGKWFYDFYDIECYDPDGNYFGDRNVDDACNYTGGNWATEWQAANGDEWWDCEPDHTQPLNGNRKARAVWQLWCAIAETMSRGR